VCTSVKVLYRKKRIKKRKKRNAKYYENPTMLSLVTAKIVGDVFLRHTVEKGAYRVGN